MITSPPKPTVLTIIAIRKLRQLDGGIRTWLITSKKGKFYLGILSSYGDTVTVEANTAISVEEKDLILDTPLFKGL
jgi:hypothetical protein